MEIGYGSLGVSTEGGEKGDQIVELSVGKLLLGVGGHRGAFFVDNGLEIGGCPGMNLFAVVHKLDGEGVLVEDYAGEGSSLLSSDGYKFIGGGSVAEVDGDVALGELRVGIADGLDEIVAGTGGADAREIRAEASSLARDHVTAGTIGFAEEKLAARHKIAGGRSGRRFLETAKIGDDVESFGFFDIVGGHGGARDAVEDVVEHGCLGLAMREVAGDETGCAEAAVGIDAVAVRAGGAESGFAVGDGLGRRLRDGLGKRGSA
jgi:hypothetical protein